MFTFWDPHTRTNRQAREWQKFTDTEEVEILQVPQDEETTTEETT